MRNLTELDKFRVPIPKVYGNENQFDRRYNGVFIITHEGVFLRIIASSGMGWDHVSVSTAARIPTWLEMEFIKRTFFEDHEIAMQLHVPSKDHINNHPYTLHLWRPRNGKIPLPPKELV